MSFLVVVLLSVLWLGFFLPSLLQARRTSSPYTSATTFQDSLRRLGEVPYPQQTGPQQAARPSRQAAVAARRRDTLAVLSAAVIAGALLAVGFGGWAVWAAPPPVVALVAYAILLRRDAVRRWRRAQVRKQAAASPGAAGIGRRQMAGMDVAQEPAFEAPSIVPSVRRRGAAQPPDRMAG